MNQIRMNEKIKSIEWVCHHCYSINDNSTKFCAYCGKWNGDDD